MSNNNAFWREVIDYLPKLVLVFRVDENERAQLIFCNKQIREQLGYAPKEYVLASEQEGVVQREIEALVDEIARRSHDVESIDPRPCTITDKNGNEWPYRIDFRLFRTKGGGSHLVNVELSPVEEQPTSSDQLSGRDAKNEKGEDEFFVCESDIMQSVCDTIQQVCTQTDRHLLLRGEQGTGKKTLAGRAFDHFPEGVQTVRWDFGEAGERAGTGDWQSARQVSDPLVLLLIHITGMQEEAQEELLELLQERRKRGLSTRVIATSRDSLEERVEEGAFRASLYYHMGFQSVLIPPLRHRKADLRAAARRYVQQAGRVLRISVDRFEESELEKLEEPDWEGNFPELFDVLRHSLLEAGEGRFEVRLKEKKRFELFPEQQISEDEVLGFDEMNKRYLERILSLTDGKIYGNDGAAALLDLKPTTLQSKLKRLGIK